MRIYNCLLRRTKYVGSKRALNGRAPKARLPGMVSLAPRQPLNSEAPPLLLNASEDFHVERPPKEKKAFEST